MGLYNFRPMFVEPILDGRKLHTIRATRKHMDKPGDTMHLYTGLRQRGPIIQKLPSGDVVRQKMARLLMRVPCVKVEPIAIANEHFVRPDTTYFWRPTIRLGDHLLDKHECESLARSDGFESFDDMMWFWEGRLPFHGHILHWSQQ